MDMKSIGKFVQNILIPLITVGTAAMVAWLNYSVSQVDHDLKQKIAKVDLSIKEAKDDRDKIKAEREFHFKIYDLVEKSIEANNEKKQEVAKQFVIVMVDGELRKRLLGVLEKAGTPNIKKETAELIKKEEVFNSEEQSIYTKPRVSSSTFDWEDWDYDIFWCSSSGPGAEKQAELIMNQLKKENAKGRIRVRELPPSINAKSGYKISGYVIRRSQDEVTQSEALKKLSQKVLSDKNYIAQFREESTNQQTKWYISAFVCP